VTEGRRVGVYRMLRRGGPNEIVDPECRVDPRHAGLVQLRLGIGLRGLPSESTIRRIAQRVNPDEFDTAESVWLARRATPPIAGCKPAPTTGSDRSRSNR
jgi:hypothetical protein